MQVKSTPAGIGADAGVRFAPPKPPRPVPTADLSAGPETVQAPAEEAQGDTPDGTAVLESPTDLDLTSPDGLIPPTLSPQAEAVRQAMLEGAKRLTAAIGQNKTIEVEAVLAELPLLINAHLVGGSAALHVAVQSGSVPMIKCLLRQALVDVNMPDADGNTPLHVAVQAKNKDAVAALLAHPDIDPNALNDQGLAPLHRAAQDNNTAVALILLAHDQIDVNAAGPPLNATPFYAAVDNKKAPMAKLLLDHGADINAPVSSGYTPLHNACQAGNLAIVKWLMKPDTGTKKHPPALLNLVAQDGATALHRAVRGHHASVVAQLMKSPDIDPNTADRDGWAPLHDAVMVANHDMVKALLGAPHTDAALPGPNGVTPLHLVGSTEQAMPLIQAFQSALAQRDKLNAPLQPPVRTPPSTRLNALIEVPRRPHSVQKIDSFKALTDIQDRWGARPVSRAAQHGRGNDVLFELRPPEMARPQKLDPTTYERGWIITGPRIDPQETLDFVAKGTEAGIKMERYGDGKQSLNWEAFKTLGMGSGDLIVFDSHAHLSEELHMVLLEFGDGEYVPLVDVVRHCIANGVLKMLLLGCEVSLAADPLANLLRSDPTIPRPADREGGYKGLDITVVGPKQETVGVLNRQAGLLFLDDCGSLLTGAKPATAMHTHSVQPQFTVGWDGARRQLAVAHRAALTADQIDTDLTAEQAKAFMESLLLMHVSTNSDAEVEELLILHGVSANARVDKGASVLNLACSSGHLKVAKKLLDHGADIDHKDDDGASSLYTAAWDGRSDLVEMLLERGANFEQTTLPVVGSATALHAASQRGHAEIVQLLLDKGANTAAQTERGSSAARLAEIAGHPHIAQRLRDWAAARTDAAPPPAL